MLSCVGKEGGHWRYYGEESREVEVTKGAFRWFVRRRCNGFKTIKHNLICIIAKLGSYLSISGRIHRVSIDV